MKDPKRRDTLMIIFVLLVVSSQYPCKLCIRKNGIAENMHIPPFPDDTGLSFGAACYGVFKQRKKYLFHITFHFSDALIVMKRLKKHFKGYTIRSMLSIKTLMKL